MAKPTKGERITGLVSTMVAIVILAAGVTAHQTHSTSRNRLVQLETDLRLQVDLALSHNRAAMKQRLESIDAVLNAWSHSRQTTDDNRKISAWIEDAIEATMPGKVRELSAAPAFSLRPESLPEQASLPSPPSGEQPSAPEETLPASLPTSRELAPATSESTGAGGLPADVLDAKPTHSPTPSGGPIPTLADPPASFEHGPGEESGQIEDLPPIDARNPPAVNPRGDRPPSNASQTVESPLNLPELERQIETYNDTLIGLDAALRHSVKAFSEAELKGHVDRLTALARQYEFLQLYYGLLSPQEKGEFPAPLSPSDAARRLQKHLNKLAEDHGGDYLRPFDAERQPVLQALDERLRAIAETKNR